MNEWKNYKLLLILKSFSRMKTANSERQTSELPDTFRTLFIKAFKLFFSVKWGWAGVYVQWKSQKLELKQPCLRLYQLFIPQYNEPEAQTPLIKELPTSAKVRLPPTASHLLLRALLFHEAVALSSCYFAPCLQSYDTIWKMSVFHRAFDKRKRGRDHTKSSIKHQEAGW